MAKKSMDVTMVLSLGELHKSSARRRTVLRRPIISIILPHHLMLLADPVNASLRPGLRRTYVNLKKTNRDRYRQEVEVALSNHSLPTYYQRGEKIFHTFLLKVASYHIHTVRHRLHEEPVPADILDVMNKRDDLRKIETRRTLAQLRTNKSTHPNSIPTQSRRNPLPLCPLCKTPTYHKSSIQLHTLIYLKQHTSCSRPTRFQI